MLHCCFILSLLFHSGHRDANGVPQPDPQKFPHGMKDLVDYIHSKNLRAGIYTDVGPQTCAGYEGSYNHDAIDALTYAQWGIDFIEEYACPKPPDHEYPELYMRMHNAILDSHNKTGHPMMLYMCVWGSENVYEWGPSHGTRLLFFPRKSTALCSPIYHPGRARHTLAHYWRYLPSRTRHLVGHAAKLPWRYQIPQCHPSRRLARSRHGE